MGTNANPSPLTSSYEAIYKLGETLPPGAEKVVVEHYLKKCKRLQYLHFNSSRYYSRWNHAIAIPMIVVNSVAAVVSTLTNENSGFLKYSITGVLAANSVLAALGKYLRFAEKQQIHTQLHLEYLKLGNQLEREIAGQQIDLKKFSELMNHLAERDNWDFPDAVMNEDV